MAALATKAAVTLGQQSPKRVVVVGTGWGGFRFLRSLDRRLFDVVVVSPRDHFVFTPLLASTTVGTIEFRAIVEPVRILRDLTYFETLVTNINPEKKTIACQDATVLHDNDQAQNQFTVAYDYLVLAPGAQSQTFGIPGVQEHAIFLKQIGDARKIRQRLVNSFQRACQPGVSREQQQNLLSFIVVGGGPTSIEFASELYDFVSEDVAKFYGKDIASQVKITLLEAGKSILGSFNQQLAQHTLDLFSKRKIQVKTHVVVKKVTQDGVVLGNGEFLRSNLVVWSTGLASIQLIKNVRFSKDNRSGRILIDQQLRVSSLKDVFALGDCAVIEGNPLPCTAQVAQQQGVYLANLFNASGSAGPVITAETKGFVYRHLAMLAYIGGWKAIADTTKYTFSGVGTWLFWRTAYWTKNVSFRNKLLIPMYWLKAWLLGRDISSF